MLWKKIKNRSRTSLTGINFILWIQRWEWEYLYWEKISTCQRGKFILVNSLSCFNNYLNSIEDLYTYRGIILFVWIPISCLNYLVWNLTSNKIDFKCNLLKMIYLFSLTGSYKPFFYQFNIYLLMMYMYCFYTTCK